MLMIGRGQTTGVTPGIPVLRAFSKMHPLNDNPPLLIPCPGPPGGGRGGLRLRDVGITLRPERDAGELHQGAGAVPVPHRGRLRRRLLHGGRGRATCNPSRPPPLPPPLFSPLSCHSSPDHPPRNLTLLRGSALVSVCNPFQILTFWGRIFPAVPALTASFYGLLYA